MGAAATELIAPGTHLGKYRVIHRIAFGGMAEIYLARASGIQGFEKYVVLKRILPQYAANVELTRMFLQFGLQRPELISNLLDPRFRRLRRRRMSG